MKTTYISCLAAGLLISLTGKSSAQTPEGAPSSSPALDILSLTSIPAGKYEVTLALKQLDGVPSTAVLNIRDGVFSGTSERFGDLKGQVGQAIGNGVFMVRLRGTGYTATQFWVFKPNGSAVILEIPDRGEKQTAVPKR